MSRYVTKDPRTYIGTESELRALVAVKDKVVGPIAARVLTYLNQLPPADPRLR